MKFRLFRIRSGFAVTALVAASMIMGLWLYIIKVDVPGQMRANENERFLREFERLQMVFDQKLDLIDLNGEEEKTDRGVVEVTLDDLGNPTGDFLPIAPTRELEPPSAEALLLYNLERHGHFDKAVSFIDQTQVKLTGDLVLLKARCLRALKRHSEVCVFLATARTREYEVAGHFRFAVWLWLWNQSLPR